MKFQTYFKCIILSTKIDKIKSVLFSRYDANSTIKAHKLNAKKKTSKVKLVNKAGENKFNKGKNFSAPNNKGKNQGKSGKKKK